MTPRETYENDRRPDISPEWDSLAPETRAAYERRAPRFAGAHLNDDTDPSFRKQRDQDRKGRGR